MQALFCIFVKKFVEPDLEREKEKNSGVRVRNAAAVKLQFAEEQAAVVAQQVLQEAQSECEVQKQQARTRLDEAAQRIVERVVNR